MKNHLLLPLLLPAFLLLISTGLADAQNTAKVTILGVFHFGGSSGDLASMHMADPFGKRRQDDIKELVAQIAAFEPTKILVEYPKEKQEILQDRYNNFLAEKDTLGVNEIYQVGFRLAKQLGHDKIFAIDYKKDLPGEDLSWGDSISEAGAHFAATWWERNFVILKNIAETIESKEDRILVIIGSGHREMNFNFNLPGTRHPEPDTH